MQNIPDLPPMPAEVERVFATFSAPVRHQLLQVRELIFTIAATTPGIGAIAETLKWGEPAYLTQETGSGTTIRLGQTKTSPPQSVVYVNCRTTLIDTCRTHFPDAFIYQGTRALRPYGIGSKTYRAFYFSGCDLRYLNYGWKSRINCFKNIK